MLKNLAKKTINSLGLEIRLKRPTQAPTVPRASLRGVLRQLSSLGLQPRGVIDVGVAKETPELYEEFPNANILLIEPLVEYEPSLQKICARYKAQYILAAAGEAAGSAILNVHPDKYGSSLLKEVEGTAVDGVPREVPMVTVDGACAERKLDGPYVIKVDAQGAELRVLAGARTTLESAEAVILEVSLFETLIGGPQLADTVDWMRARGFVAYDVYGLYYRPFDGALCQMDMVFVRETGRFRESHAFATPEQRRTHFRIAEEEFLETDKKKP